MTRLFNDVDLHAFVDGQVGPDRRKAIAAYLKGASEDAGRVELWNGQNAAIRALFAGPETEPVPLWLIVGQIASGRDRLLSLPRTKARPATPRTSPSRTRSMRLRTSRATLLAVASAFIGGVAVTVAALGMMGAGRPPLSLVAPAPRGVVAFALSAYALYAHDPDHAFEVAASTGGALKSWLESRVGRLLPMPNLTGVGWTLCGGRIAQGPETPAAVLVYEKAGERLLLYVTPTAEVLSDAEPPASIASLAWSDDGLGYVLMSDGAANASTDLDPVRAIVEKAVRS